MTDALPTEITALSAGLSLGIVREFRYGAKNEKTTTILRFVPWCPELVTFSNGCRIRGVGYKGGNPSVLGSRRTDAFNFIAGGCSFIWIHFYIFENFWFHFLRRSKNGRITKIERILC